MGSTYSYETKAGKRWEARYRKPDGKTARKGGFHTKREATAYLATVEVSKLTGSYVAPSAGVATIETLGTDWLAAHQATVKASTFHSDESAWRIHVQPKWGSRKVGSIRHGEVVAWVAELAKAKSPTTVTRAHGVLAAILDTALRDRRISSNPARDVKLPRRQSATRSYLTHAQVELLAEGSKHPDFVRFLAYTGLRWGEATGLRVRHVDQTKRRLFIEENAVVVNGHVKVGTPKTHERRSVVYPSFLAPAIAEAAEDKKPGDLLWGDGTTHLRPGNAKSGWFVGAVRRAQDADPDFPRITPHDLRHTAASLAISAGANVKAVQRMLGHASAAMTLDRYSGLFADDLETVATALDDQRSEQLQR